MTEEKLYNKMTILLKRVSRDLDKNISPKKCNDYIDDLELLKDELYDFDYDWIEDYEEVEGVEEPGMLSDGADKDEIHEALEEVYDQLERILGRLGVDTSEHYDAKQPSGNMPSITVNVSPKMTQHVETSANAQVNVEIKQKVERLVREFEEEYQKPFPDKSRLKSIIEKLKIIGPYAAPFVKKLSHLLGELFF